jgi:transmembrane sensor
VWIAVAAAAAVAVLFLGRPWPWSPGGAGALHAEELVTGRGESTTVRLSDGSVVRLGPESRLAVVTGASARQVTLEGRAFFAVTHDPRRPFRVITPAGTARVLGTRFELEAEVSDLRLVVVEGSVALASNDSEVEVRSGQMTEMRSGRAGPVRSAPGLAQLSSEWMGRFLVFQDTPLRTAAEEIAALYDVEVRIVDPSVGGRTLTMWSSSRPLEDVLTVACSVADVSCRIDGRTVTIAARAPATPDASEENHEEDRP